jgi:hypothetical protein
LNQKKRNAQQKNRKIILYTYEGMQI